MPWQYRLLALANSLPAVGSWLLIGLLTANSPARRTSFAHTHWFDQPLEAAKFRFVSTGGASWPIGNLRWGELVFHGEVLGRSESDLDP